MKINFRAKSNEERTRKEQGNGWEILRPSWQPRLLQVQATREKRGRWFIRVRGIPRKNGAKGTQVWKRILLPRRSCAIIHVGREPHSCRTMRRDAEMAFRKDVICYWQFPSRGGVSDKLPLEHRHKSPTISSLIRRRSSRWTYRGTATRKSNGDR